MSCRQVCTAARQGAQNKAERVAAVCTGSRVAGWLVCQLGESCSNKQCHPPPHGWCCGLGLLVQVQAVLSLVAYAKTLGTRAAHLLMGGVVRLGELKRRKTTGQQPSAPPHGWCCAPGPAPAPAASPCTRKEASGPIKACQLGAPVSGQQADSNQRTPLRAQPGWRPTHLIPVESNRKPAPRTRLRPGAKSRTNPTSHPTARSWQTSRPQWRA